MAESVSFLLRKAPIEQLKRGMISFPGEVVLYFSLKNALTVSFLYMPMTIE